MKINITLLILYFCSVGYMSMAQEVREREVNIFATYAEALEVRPVKKDTMSNIVKEAPDKFVNILFLKLKQGKENNIYKPIVPVDKDRYELLDKGASFVSLVLGFGKSQTDNLFIEPIVKMNNVYSTKLDIELAGGYFIDKNTAIGGRLGYALSDTRVNMNSPIFELMFNTRDMSMNGVTTNMLAGFFVKNFIPLDPNNRVFIVNETRLGYTYGHTITRDEYKEGALIRKSEQRRNSIGVGITPGLMYFLNDNLSLEFLISPVLAYYEHTSITNNEIEEGSFKGGAVNFIVTPIKMNFGISYFFGLNR